LDQLAKSLGLKVEAAYRPEGLTYELVVSLSVIGTALPPLKVQQARANLITSCFAHRPTLTAIAYELNFFPTIRGDFSGSYSHRVKAAWAEQMTNKR
jgi:hypothetical protein